MVKNYRTMAITTAAASVLALGVGTGSANAASLDIFGGSTAFGASLLFENVITGDGQTLSGYGLVSTITPPGVLAGLPCSNGPNNCEVTFTFGGYTSKNFAGTAVEFDGGWVNVWVDDTPDFNPGVDTNATNITNAGNGMLWLTLEGRTNFYPASTVAPKTATLRGIGTTAGTLNDNGSGAGLMDIDNDATHASSGNPVAGIGMANATYDTNLIPDLIAMAPVADFNFISSFGNGLLSAYTSLSAECLAAPAPAAGVQQTLACLVGTGTLNANAQISEPGTIASLGLGLIGLGALRRRRKVIA